jgi:2-polyprenyl-6-methoxyphenol hydroxylase-like FAD-dependent oxidoreductase
MDVIIIGAGIGGLPLGLALHRTGIPCHIYEAAPAIAPIGVGINLLPHATRELAELDLEAVLARVGVSTAEGCFFNRFGQLIYREPLGRAAAQGAPVPLKGRPWLTTSALQRPISSPSPQSR